MAQKDVTINDILNGGKGSPGNGGTTATGTTGSTDTTSSQPAATVGGNNTTSPDYSQGVVDFGNSANAQSKKPVTTAEATDPTQAAINLVEQHRQQQAQQTPTPASTGNVVDDFMNFSREQHGQTPEKSPVFTPNVQTTTRSSTTSTNGNTTTSPTGSNGDVGKDKDAAAVDTEPQDSKKKSAMSYADMFAAMEPYKEPTKEELEKERKKEKRERLFAAIGDGISALSNLFFTTQYAPNMYDPNKETNSEKVEHYWTNLRKEREANRRRYVDGYIKAKQADDLHAIQQQNADVAEDYKKSEKERKAKAQEIINARIQAMTDLYNEKAKGIGKTNEAQVKYLEAKIDALNRGLDIKEATARAEIAYKEALINKANRTGSGGNSGGKSGTSGGSGGRIPWYDKNGNLHYAKTEGEAIQKSKLNGTYVDDYATNSSNMIDSNGKPVGIGTKRTSRSGWHSRKPSAPAKKPTTSKKGGGAKGGNWASVLKL